MKTVQDYLTRKHYETHPPLDEKGLWEIYGEDANCDFGGHHHEPFLEMVEGTYEQAIEYALTLQRFFTWGAGGSIKKHKLPKITKLGPQRASRRSKK